jgi:hypothetical protein
VRLRPVKNIENEMTSEEVFRWPKGRFFSLAKEGLSHTISIDGEGTL